VNFIGGTPRTFAAPPPDIKKDIYGGCRNHHKKASGLALSDEEVGFIIEGYVDGSIPEYQISALLMAIFYKA